MAGILRKPFRQHTYGVPVPLHGYSTNIPSAQTCEVEGIVLAAMTWVNFSPIFVHVNNALQQVSLPQQIAAVQKQCRYFNVYFLLQ